MAKLYTLDNKLLAEKPAIQIGEKFYAVDNRKSTVEKVMELTSEKTSQEISKNIDAVFDLAFGKDSAEIKKMDMPYPAFTQLTELIIAAMTGEEPEVVDKRFQEAKKSAT